MSRHTVFGIEKPFPWLLIAAYGLPVAAVLGLFAIALAL